MKIWAIPNRTIGNL